MFAHRANIQKSQTSQLGLYRRLRNLIESGRDFEPRKVFESDNELDVLTEENRRINLYGLHNLFNSTNLSGSSPENYTEMIRQAMSKAAKERARKNRLIYGQAFSPETVAKIRKSLKRKLKNHPQSRWKTKEQCIEHAKQFKWLGDWCQTGSFSIARRQGWVSEIVKQLSKDDKLKPKLDHRTLAHCQKSAKQFQSRTAWQHDPIHGKTYQFAYRNGLLKQCCNHMTRPSRRWPLIQLLPIHYIEYLA